MPTRHPVASPLPTPDASPRRTAALSTVVIVAALVAMAARPPCAPAAPNTFVVVSDGTEIAMNVRMPSGYVPGLRYPTVFEMSGYDGGSAEDGTLITDLGLGGLGLPLPLPSDDSRQLTDYLNGEYVTIHASVRGSGCSSGEFDLFSTRSALDGKEIIDGWIARQPWSNGDVGILGHSYGGITGFMVAATQPRHLRAVTVSGLIDDLYRAIVYPGGVTNYGFPLLWTLGIRTAYDVAGGLLPGIIRPQSTDDVQDRQQRCALNVLHKSRTVLNDPVLQGLQDTDNDWYRARSLITYAGDIRVPIHMTGAYQDEQTGPRGPAHLFEAIAGVPKRLLVSNGDHDTESTADYGLPEVRADRKAWLDHFVRGKQKGFGTVRQAKASAVTYFEVHRDAAGTLVPNATKTGTDYPYPDTQWTRWYLTGDGGVTTLPPAGVEAARSYVSATKRQLWSYQAGPTVGPPVTTMPGPDELDYRSEPLASAVAIAGPVAATLYMQATGIDTEIFVQLVDEAPDGSLTYLQRGLLRASHRAIDAAASDRTPDGRIYRPHRPHTSPSLITPNGIYEYLVEIWPVGHVFRPGHRIGVKIHMPPWIDSFYVYVPRSAPTLNTVLHGSVHPSHVLLPIVPVPAALGPALPCGAQEAVRCIPPAP